MPDMRPPTAIPVLLLLLVAAAAAPAEAQRGPAPGQDALGYAQGHAAGTAGKAASDPVGFAATTATPAGAGKQAEEAGYIACWLAYEQTRIVPPGCELFFVPP
ncbi:MAG TPA: hypothetical protein VFH47_00715, partial [Candidatus Thermoplasmatota archaeon]|nr:hypothetical protein [Candidatus Thermoplasmatota archaeon]